MKLQVISFLLALFTLFSCNTKNSVDLTYLNGYWEIDRAITSCGSEKKYNFNPMVDYFATKDSVGFRAKLKPNFTGTYEGSKQQINYTVSRKGEKYVITYKNASNTWKDILIKATENQLCIENNEGTQFYYRKFTPIKINEEK
ncbi:hypothetical protein [Aquimarina agarivorans]|uniref:hypothetical protein n=1 Tax=Aquimarina agarivorans TaxID=980584 RepID=UPI000248F5B6|nr:hypothetical protein [Aquimarina agarivorans]